MLNPSIAFVAFLMIVLGAASGFYPVSILGLLILVASLLAPNRRPGPRRPSVLQKTGDAPYRTAPQRVAPPSPQPHIQLSPVPQSAPETMFPQPSNQGYASNMALFPSAMFPSASAAPMAQQPSAQNQAPALPEAKDEVVELAALVVFLRLLSG